jgi:hypothetical protein
VERYEAVHRFLKDGFSQLEIAKRLRLNWKTVARYAHADTFPERPERPPHPGLLAPYETYLRIRFLEGEHNGTQLFREVTAQGYKGARMTVTRFLLGLRRLQEQGIQVTAAATTTALTPRRAVGLMLRRQKELTTEETAALRQVCQLHPQVERLHALFGCRISQILRL